MHGVAMAKRGSEGRGGARQPAARATAPLDTLKEAVTHFNAGRLGLAERKARDALARQPDDASAHNLLGNIAFKRARYGEAAGHYRKALRGQANNPFIHFNFAETLRRAGDGPAALEQYRIARTLKPDFAEAFGQEGDLLRAHGDWQAAAGAYEKAVAIAPHYTAAQNGLGQVHLHRGAFAAAARAFESAIRTARKDAPAGTAPLYANLGHAHLQDGNLPAAISALIEAFSIDPGTLDYGRLLARALRHVAVLPEDSRMREVLAALLTRNDINPRPLASAVHIVLMRVGAFDAPPSPQSPVLSDPLFTTFLTNAPIGNATCELWLTALRRKFLLDGTADVSLTFLCALAQQCHLNEYVFYAGPDEDERLAAQIAAFASRPPDWHDLALVACYRPLATLSSLFSRADAPAQFHQLIRIQIDDPAREQAIAAGLETLRPLSDATSLAVQNQYEENPYPRWTHGLSGTPQPLAAVVRQALPHLDPSELLRIDAPRVLIAGCGTGLQTMRVVNTYKDATVLGVDLSRASLAYGMRKLEEAGIVGVRHLHGDILDLGVLTERFDLIESFGVIHHMREPEKGLNALTGLLRPGGILFLGLYSAIGRSGVVAARDFIAARGFQATADGIRAARKDILEHGSQGPLGGLLSPASDFWTLSDCRDLIFHVEEHRFTLLEIDAMFKRHGLAFLGLELANPADRHRFKATCPDPAAARSLAVWHDYETRFPETFGDTYRLWARKLGD